MNLGQLQLEVILSCHCHVTVNKTTSPFPELKKEISYRFRVTFCAAGVTVKVAPEYNGAMGFGARDFGT